MRTLALLVLLSACAGNPTGGDHDAATTSADARLDGDGNPVADDAGTASCATTGPAYVHGDLWAFWHNYRVACDRQHKWWWICRKRLGEGNCPEERLRFEQCWTATGEFPPSTWDGSTPTPHSANYGVCQPIHWSEKNGDSQRPGNPVPCDTTQNDYDQLRTSDPRYGVDWWAGGTSMRHLTVKVFDEGQNPQAQEGQSDALVNLSTHPGKQAAFMNGLSNHSYPGHTRAGGCVAELSGDDEAPYPAQNFGAFYWLEVPTDRPVTLAASWIGPIGDDIGLGCLNIGIDGFPNSFAYHSVDGKPWFISSPCWDLIENVQLEPGRHYVWDVDGFRTLPGCGVPERLLELARDDERAALRDGSCSSM